MAFNQSFSINAVRPVNPAQISLVDTSTGSDPNIASRQVSILTINNSLLIPVTPWSIGQPELDLTPLTQDQALNIIVNWLAVDGVTKLYTATAIFSFDNFTQQFLYSLTQAQTAQPDIVNDQEYFKNKQLLRLYLDDAKQAIDVGADIYAAQSLLQKAVNMVQQHQLYFNV